MRKFLYLTKREFVKTWVNGGTVPLSMASSYFSEERKGTSTPDENLIHKGEFPIPQLEQFGLSFGNVRVLNMSGNTFNGVPMPEITNGAYYREDALVLCLSNTLSPDIARRLGNKKACVEILNIERLARSLDRQLGCESERNICTYTNLHHRDHFQKSVEDAWQEEFRFVWKLSEERKVKIPKGTSRLVALFD